jgi:hypothetical protein
MAKISVDIYPITKYENGKIILLGYVKEERREEYIYFNKEREFKLFTDLMKYLDKLKKEEIKP